MRALVAVHGRFHGFELATELHARGGLARLLTTYPAPVARRLLPAGLPLATAPWLELARRGRDRLGLGWPSDVAIGAAFARFVARHLDGDILIGWSGATLEAIPAARARGMVVVIERGSSHIRHQAEVMARAGQPHAVDPAMIAREEAEYAAADAISVPTRFAAATFVAHGIAAAKLRVNPYGADLARFHPAAAPPVRPRPRALFVGRVGVRKGVPWLLEAVAGLDLDLHLVGPLEPGFRPALPPNAILRGPLPGEALAAEYRAADMFVLPSLEEGLPLVLLQALASGLPCVATPETGAEDIGAAVTLVPAVDTAALATALAGLAADRRLRAELGRAGRAAVEAGFSWSDYGERAVARLVAG